MLQSPPKYLFSIEIEISATVLNVLKEYWAEARHFLKSSIFELQIHKIPQKKVEYDPFSEK